MKFLRWLVPLWLVCGFLNWGMIMGKFTDEYPEFNQVPIATFAAATGVPGLIASFVFGAGHWRLVPLTKEQSWEAYHKLFPDLAYSDFESTY